MNIFGEIKHNVQKNILFNIIDIYESFNML